MVKNLPAVQETRVRSLGWEGPLEKEMATYSSLLAWRIPWGLYSPWGSKELDRTEQLSLTFDFIHVCSSPACVCVWFFSPHLKGS